MSIVTTKNEVSVYPVGDASYITKLGPGAIDAAGLWVYCADGSISDDKPARILRLNMLTFAVEVWRSTTDLPAGKAGLCFSHDYSQLLLVSSGNSNLYAIDFATKAMSIMGDLGKSYTALKQLPGGIFLLYDFIAKNFDKLSLGPVSVTSDIVTSDGWSALPDVTAAGEVYRAWQRNGPGTNGPIYHTLAGKLAFTKIDAGQINAFDGSSFGAAHLSYFNCNAIAVTPDGVYFASEDSTLNIIAGGNVSQVGAANSGRTILAASLQNNVILTMHGQTVYFWN